MALFDFVKSGRGSLIEGIASEWHCNYAEMDEVGLSKLLSDFQLWKKGSAQKVRNILSTEIPVENLSIRILDYQYVTQDEESRKVNAQSLVLFDTKELSFPRFILEPYAYFDRHTPGIGFENIDFPEHPGFSGRYYLMGDQEPLIRKIFKEEALDYFGHHTEWSVEGQNTILVVYKDGNLPAPEEIRGFLDESLRVYATFLGREVSLNF